MNGQPQTIRSPAPAPAGTTRAAMPADAPSSDSPTRSSLDRKGSAGSAAKRRRTNNPAQHSAGPPSPTFQLNGGPKASLDASAAAGPCSLVWFRGHDLRVEDHPALLAASQCAAGSKSDGAVVAVFVYTEDPDVADSDGSQVSAWWLSESLPKLKEDLARLGVPLVLRKVLNSKKTDVAEVRRRQLHMAVVDELLTVQRALGATAVFWNRVYDQQILKWDEALRNDLASKGITAESFKAELLVEPWELQDSEISAGIERENTSTDDGRPPMVFKTFFSYMKGWMALPPPPPPIDPPLIREHIDHDRFDQFSNFAVNELARISPEQRAKKLSVEWKPGSFGAKTVLEEFLQDSFASFGEARCRRDINGTSRLSPYLKFGELSPRRVYHAVRSKVATWEHWDVDNRHSISQSAKAFLKNICLRDYSHHAYFYNPTASETPLLNAFEQFPWQDDPQAFERWRTGMTGYPIVDASMRQLRATGWIHNTLRFLVASFLTKYLLLPFRLGVQEFQKLLVDSDWASNSLGWQWAAGCSEDGFPFRCLVNPIGIGRRQDPTGYFIRTWVPELAALPDNHIHCPWKTPQSTLALAGVVLGKTYPQPMIDAAFARTRAREAMQTMKHIFMNSNSAANVTLVPREVTDLIEEWPEEETDDTSNVGEQSTASKLGLLPALWRLLHYDQPPSVGSLKFPANTHQKPTDNGGDVTQSAAGGRQQRNPPVAAPIGGTAPSGSGSSFQMIPATGMGSMTHNPAAPPPASGVMPSSIPPSTFYVPMVAAPPHAVMGSMSTHNFFGQDGQRPPSSVPYYGMLPVRVPGDSSEGVDPFGQSRFYNGPQTATIMAHDMSANRAPHNNTSSSLNPSFSMHGMQNVVSPTGVMARPARPKEPTDAPGSSSKPTRRRKENPDVSDQKKASNTGSGEKTSNPSTGKSRGLRRPTPAPKSHQDAPSTNGPMSLEARKEILDKVSKNKENEYFAFVSYLLRTFSLTENTDRASSSDFVRLCKLKEDFQKVCSEGKDKMQIYKIKAFFKDILNLEVTGEWDRRGHGGVRGPYVYGLRPHRPELFGPTPKAPKR